MPVFVPWNKYLHKNKSEFNIQNSGLQCTSVQAPVKAPPGRMQLYSRNSIYYSYWNFVEGSKHKPVSFYQNILLLWTISCVWKAHYGGLDLKMSALLYSFFLEKYWRRIMTILHKMVIKPKVTQILLLWLQEFDNKLQTAVG